MKAEVIIRGFITGLILQIAVGPVFLFIVNLSLEYGLLKGLSAVSGVLLVDYLYILLAIYGVGKLLEVSKFKKAFMLISSIVLVIFGSILLRKGLLFNFEEQIELRHLSLVQSFGSTFLLTISSPLTIVFWTSIFTSKSIEYSLTKEELLPFGLAAGFATAVFLGSSVIILSLLNSFIPIILIRIMNVIVGFILLSFGIIRIFKDFKLSVFQ